MIKKKNRCASVFAIFRKKERVSVVDYTFDCEFRGRKINSRTPDLSDDTLNQGFVSVRACRWSEVQPKLTHSLTHTFMI